MAQTLTEDKLNVASTEFSDLAWRFNNLNSTAKMLLVGTNSQSVPFIPISELAYETTPIQNDNSLSLSSLASTQPQESPNVYLKPVEPKVEQEYKPIVASSLVETETPKEEISESPLPFAPVYTSSVLIPEKKEEVLTEKSFAKTEEQEELTSSNLENLNEYSAANNGWSYRRPYLEDAEEEEYENQTNYYKEENKKPSFWGPFLRTTGAVSALALICAGAFYFLNNTKKPKEDPLLEELSQTTPTTQTDTTNTNTTNTYSADKNTYSPEKNTYSSENKTFVDEAPNSSTDGYYHPKIETKPAKKTTSKPKVYKQPTIYSNKTKTSHVHSGYPYYSGSNTNTSNPTYTSSTPTYTSAEETIIKAKPQPLFDPTTIYDSTATKAITPETYTAEEFPLEISYTKESPQFEAAFVPPNAKQFNTQNNFAAPRNVEEIEDANSNSLTDEEKEIMPENSSVPVYNQPIQKFNNTQNTTNVSVPLYSKPINSESQTNNNQQTNNFSAPNTNNFEEELVLRKPVQSSSNFQNPEETFATPYKQNDNLTTTMVVQEAAPVQQTPQRKTSFFRKRKYTQQYRQEAAQNNANSAINACQDRLRQIQRKAEGNNLTENERNQLLGEVEVLKRNISQTQKELDETTQLINKANSPYSKQNLNQIENEANKVYLKPSFDEEESDSSLDLGYL